MGRGDSTNTAASNQASGWQEAAVTRANNATDAFNKKLGTLQSGGTIAANPFTNPDYLRNQNIQVASASSSANDAGRQQLLDTAQRTGENTAGTQATIRQLARDKMRTMTDATAGRAASDYGNYLDWERFILGSTLAPANVDTSLFSTATGQRNNADTNIANENMAANNMWANILGAGLQAGGTVGASALGGGGPKV